jgi:hypothetical protein
MKWMNPFVACCFSTLALLTMPASVGAAESMLTAEVEVLFPVPPSGRGGGVAAMGGAQMQRIDAGKSADGRGLLRLSADKAPVQGVWWFPNHLPLTAQQAMVGDKQARLIFEIEAAQPVESELSVQWRVEGKAGAWVHSGPLKLGPAHAAHVELPVPALAEGAKINGLILSFNQPGDYHVRRLALARLSAALLNPIAPAALRQAKQVTITGRAAGGINQVTLRLAPENEESAPAGKPVTVQKTVPVREGRYELTVTPRDLTPGLAYRVTAAPSAHPDALSPAQRLFVYPLLTGQLCPPVTRRGSDLIRNGKRFGFVGVNYTRFMLGLSNHANYEQIAHDVLQMKSFGVRVARVSIDLGMIQPELGVTADNPKYKQLMIEHNLDPAFVDQLDYFVQLAGENGIYTVIDWHGMATDPYRYFLGGNEQQRKEGKPGTAIAYNAPSTTQRGEFDLSNPRHVESLLNAHRWAAAHFKGNPNLLGIEIPFNEPHTKYMAVEANWRRITDQCAKAMAEGDPQRLTFTLGPSYSHNNLLPSVTWLPPDRASGAAPHFYQANGPVPVRPDAKKFREPWLARETEGTFGWSFTAVMMPFSAVHYPLYNGETGAHGAEMVLPDHPRAEAVSYLIEAQLVQEYATGMSGRLEWTMWGNKGGFVPFVDVYRTLFNRFAPVYDAGPLDRQAAEVAFIQNPEALPTANGYNYACIPFAKAALDLHLPPEHYLSGDQFRYFASAELSVGLEQVVQAADALHYKALVVDQRYLDPGVVALIKSSRIPTLWLDKAEDLSSQQLGAFLRQAGVTVDEKTPRDIQLVEGPEHLIAYRRLDGGTNPTMIYPKLKHAGSFRLVNESGKSVFEGDAASLAEKGIQVDLPLWRSRIFQIVKQ